MPMDCLPRTIDPIGDVYHGAQSFTRFAESQREGIGDAGTQDVVDRTLREFIPKESLQTEQVLGLDEAMQDALRFKYLTAPLSPQQLSELIQIPGTKR